MKLIHSSIRNASALDMLRVASLAPKAHAQMKQLARKQLRARERQAFVHEDLQEAFDFLTERGRAKANVQVKMVKQQARSRRKFFDAIKSLESRISAYPLTQFVGRQVLVRFVDAAEGQPVTQVYASCAID